MNIKVDENREIAVKIFLRFELKKMVTLQKYLKKNRVPPERIREIVGGQLDKNRDREILAMEISYIHYLLGHTDSYAYNPNDSAKEVIVTHSVNVKIKNVYNPHVKKYIDNLHRRIEIC